MPSVTALRMDLGVAGRTKRHQVRFTMVAVFWQRLDVMHLIRFGKPTFFLALLAKRVCIHVSVTDAFPCLTIPTLDCGVPSVLFIALVLQFLMLLSKGRKICKDYCKNNYLIRWLICKQLWTKCIFL